MAISAGTNYGVVMGWCYANPTENIAWEVIPTSGALSDLYCELSSAPGGVGKTHTIAISVNGSIVGSPVVVMTNTDTTGNDTVNSIDVVAGDTVTYQIVTLSTPAAANLYASCYFTGSTSGESICLGHSDCQTGLEAWGPVQGKASSKSPEAGNYQIIPTPGTLKSLYVALSADPGTSPDAYTFTVEHDGGTTTGITCTIVANNTTGNDIAHTHAMNAGEDVAISFLPVSTPSVASLAGYGLVFVADTDGESLILGGNSDNLNTSTTEYNPIQSSSGSSSWDATEANNYQLLNACTLRKFYVELSAAPGADGDAYTFNVRVEGASPASNPEVAIVNAATTGNDTTNTATIASGNTVGIECAPSVSPTSRDAYWGIVAYIASSVDYPITISGANLSVSVSIDRNVAWNRALSPGLSISVSLSRAVAYTRTFAKNLTVAISMAIARGRKIAFSTALSVSVSISRKVSYHRTTASNLSVAISIARTWAVTKAFSTALSIAVAISKVRGSIKTFASNLTVSISMNRKVNYNRAFSKNLTVSVAMSRVVAYARSVATSLSASISISRAVTWTRATATALSVAISIMAFWKFLKVNLRGGRTLNLRTKKYTTTPGTELTKDLDDRNFTNTPNSDKTLDLRSR
jgi:hypothetical protein